MANFKITAEQLSGLQQSLSTMRRICEHFDAHPEDIEPEGADWKNPTLTILAYGKVEPEYRFPSQPDNLRELLFAGEKPSEIACELSFSREENDGDLNWKITSTDVFTNFEMMGTCSLVADPGGHNSFMVFTDELNDNWLYSGDNEEELEEWIEEQIAGYCEAHSSYAIEYDIAY